MDKVLKQRLVGASILIALAVIFLPMLFDGDPGDSARQRELALDLPERSGGEQRIRRLALDPSEAHPPGRESGPRPQPEESGSGPEADYEASQAEAPKPGPEAEAGEGEGGLTDQEQAPDPIDDPADGESEREPVPAETDERPESPDVEPGPEAVAAGDGEWTVQVAVFGNRDTAESIRQRLEDLGHPVMVDVIVRNRAELSRLRTGPYASERQAGQARDQIAATVAGVEPVARRLDGVSGGESRSGLSVQVGSFASRNNAERLVEQLGSSGHDAFMHGEDSGGRTIWRVRVGIFANREDAERLLERLGEEEGLQGIVVSHP